MRKFITWDHGMSKEAFIKLQEWLKDKPKDSDVIMPIQNFIDMKIKKTTLQQKQNSNPLPDS